MSTDPRRDDAPLSSGAPPPECRQNDASVPPAVSAAQALAAIALTAAIVVGAIVSAGVAVDAIGAASGRQLAGPERMLAFLLVLQTVIVLASIAVSGAFGRRADILSWRPVKSWRADVLPVLVLMFGVLGLFTLFAFTWFRDLVMSDLAHFRPLLAGDLAFPAAVALAVGAPLSEELLFRGFLMGVLGRSRLGFFGAALIATLGWTALHMGYTPIGLIEVFLAGLIFSWALWRTGSILVPIVCHALYNLTVLIVLWSFLAPG